MTYTLVKGYEWCNRVMSNSDSRGICDSKLKEMGRLEGVIACTQDGKYSVGASISHAVTLMTTGKVEKGSSSLVDLALAYVKRTFSGSVDYQVRPIGRKMV